MKDLQTKEKFIELRARGLSFNKIAEKIEVSKPTLLKWSSEFSDEIANRRFLASEELLERYQLTKIARMEVFAKTLNLALQEFQARKFDLLSTKDLLTLINFLDNQLSKEAKSVNYLTGEMTSILDNVPGYQAKTFPLID